MTDYQFRHADCSSQVSLFCRFTGRHLKAVQFHPYLASLAACQLAAVCVAVAAPGMFVLAGFLGACTNMAGFLVVKTTGSPHI